MGRSVVTDAAVVTPTLCGRTPNDADCMMCPDLIECGEMQEEAAYLRGLVDRPEMGMLKVGDWI
jgi:hypothetical protein